MNNSKILAAVIGGIAAGIGLGLLFAPAKGSTTRTKLFDPFKSREAELKARAARRTGNIKMVKSKAQEAAAEAARMAAGTEFVKSPVETIKPDSARHTAPASGIAQKNASPSPAVKKIPARAATRKESRPSRTRSNPGNN